MQSRKWPLSLNRTLLRALVPVQNPRLRLLLEAEVEAVEVETEMEEAAY